jgi:anti-anti-sigma factor
MPPNSPSSSITTSFVNGVCTVILPPIFAVNEAIDFQAVCRNIFQTGYKDIRQITLDFGATTFLDSSGLGSLVICRRLCEQNQVDMVLKEVGPQVMMVLNMTNLDKVFTIAQQHPAEDALPMPSRQLERQIRSTHPSVASKAKRLMDIVGGLIGLSVTAVLVVPIAIAIQIDDPGPIFFSQTRCSWMGRRFRIWKFRSMVMNAESLKNQVKNEVEGPLFKNENDPRVTRVGRFLRKTSLDEFPQFWNVLRGDMSLVGTRPPTPAEIAYYEVPAWQRLNVKPGLTGEWQVNGRSTIKKFEDVIRLDMKYQENWSLMYDVKLIIKTVLVLFTKKAGAA